MQVKEIQIEGQQFYSGKAFPFVLTPNENVSDSNLAVEWASQNINYILECLANHGVVIFRDFGVNNVQQLLQFIEAFKWNYGSYRGGGGPRNVVLGPIHTSTESPPEFKIPFHHELAYLTEHPSKLFFYCEIPCEQGGETPIMLSNQLYEKIKQINEQFVNKLAEKKVRYIRTIKDRSNCSNAYQRCWQETFQTEDKQIAEQIAKETGGETIEWSEDNSMRVTTRPLEAFRIDPRTNYYTWFNSVALLHPAAHGGSQKLRGETPWTTVYGDYSIIDDNDILSIVNVMDSLTVQFKWKAYDIVLVDNFLALHSRNSFSGPRRILTTVIA
eukprot:TRINITY_DN204_c0_g3_i1.p1 TRINITY_DN204_c0_g3~~TRINITY_DN204_c0_g3_i1.p1  ORF type:complete len:328 (+),score=167.72 TRINITY_DN204_c0_g3_i1:59-1042(+)